MAAGFLQHMFFCESGFRCHKFCCNRSKDSNETTLHLNFFAKKATLIFQCINLSVLNIIELRFKKCHILSNIKLFSPFEGQPTFKQSQNKRTLIGIASLFFKKILFYHVTGWCCQYPKVTTLGLVEFNAGANT